MDVITFGETMVLFTPENTGFMRYANNFSRKFGGAESNFAIGLSRLGHQVGWVSRVGEDEFGKAMVSFIRGEGVDVSQVKMDKEAPTGLYFKEIKKAQEFNVYYYRKDSAASRMSKEDLDEKYLAKAKYLFLSGITPALSKSCREMVFEAIKIAKRNNIKIIFDPNLRRKLWDEEEARKVLLEICAQSDIILPGQSEGEFLFGESDTTILGEKFLQLGAKLVVIKLGDQGAAYFTNDNHEFVPGFHVKHLVDPVGAGDGFAAGFVSGLIDELNLYDSVRRANAVGALVTMVSGDVEGLPEREDIENFMGNILEDVNR